jgi:hypothetical protein
MNKPVQTLKPVQIGGNMYEVERIARAMEHAIICYRAVPGYPQNKEVRDGYLKQYETACAEMLGALHNV